MGTIDLPGKKQGIKLPMICACRCGKPIVQGEFFYAWVDRGRGAVGSRACQQRYDEAERGQLRGDVAVQK